MALPPSAPPHFLSNPCFIVALRTRLDLDIPCQVGRCQHRGPNGAICGEPLDSKGKHARSCKKGGWIVRKHNAIVAEVGKWCEEHECYVEKEVILPRANPDHPESRIDLVVHIPNHTPIYIDVTIVSALSAEALRRGSGNKDGTACIIAAQKKSRTYPGITVTAFVVEEHGRFGEDALSFLRKVGPLDPALRPLAPGTIFQTVSTLVQRWQAEAIVASCTPATHSQHPQEASQVILPFLSSGEPPAVSSLISPLPSPRASQGLFPAPHVPVALAEPAVQLASMYGGLAPSSGGDGSHTPFPTSCPSPNPSPSCTQNPQATEVDGDEVMYDCEGGTLMDTSAPQ